MTIRADKSNYITRLGVGGMMQQLSFDGRTRLEVMVDLAIKRLQHYAQFDERGYYLAFSGGKDSQCIYHLAKEAGVKFDAHYNQTGIDPPELVYNMRKHYPDVIVEPYEKSMWQLIRENGIPPLRTARYCCVHLKERGGEGRIVVTGVRAAESTMRKKNWGIVNRCSPKKAERAFAFDPEQGEQLMKMCPTKGKIMVAPIFDWTDEDVWAYIRDRNLPYCSLYDEGFKRLGCIGCPMASKGREQQFLRWPKFKEAYIRTFDEMLRLHPDKAKPTWKTGHDVFDWWMSDVAAVGDDDGLFEEVSP
jgi:phosphoadenosine phosphosulfate reductase